MRVDQRVANWSDLSSSASGGPTAAVAALASAAIAFRDAGQGEINLTAVLAEYPPACAPVQRS